MKTILYYVGSTVILWAGCLVLSMLAHFFSLYPYTYLVLIMIIAAAFHWKSRQ